MTRSALAIGPCVLALLAACSAPPPAPGTEVSPDPVPAVATDDGTYLSQIDPWAASGAVERIGNDDFTAFDAWVNFSAGGFLNHGAGCSGGFPAFYALDGDRVTLTRLEPIQTGKCNGRTGAILAEAVRSERRLAGFLDALAAWSRPDDTRLVLSAADGTQAILGRPAEPHPDLAGRWLIQTIGGAPFATERRPATLSFALNGIGAHGDCNSFGGTYSVPAPGRLSVVGPMMSTAIGCAPEDAEEDATMSRAMVSATGYRIQGDRLELTGGPGLTAERPPAPDRALPGEYRACGNTLLGAFHSGPVSLVVDARTMTDNAGCRATYVADGPRLTLRPDPETCQGAPTPFVAGQAIDIGGSVSTLATVPPDGFAFDDQGRLILRTHRGLLSLCRKGSPPLFGE